MKLNLLIATFVFPVLAAAQQVDVKGVDADSSTDGTTTIQIKKGKDAVLPDNKPKWETQEGSADVNGEEGATTKDAKANWKKACTDWKKEFREDNKDNKILSVNCGNAECGGDAGSKVCTSKATYKIRTRTE